MKIQVDFKDFQLLNVKKLYKIFVRELNAKFFEKFLHSITLKCIVLGGERKFFGWWKIHKRENRKKAFQC